MEWSKFGLVLQIAELKVQGWGNIGNILDICKENGNYRDCRDYSRSIGGIASRTLVVDPIVVLRTLVLSVV